MFGSQGYRDATAKWKPGWGEQGDALTRFECEPKLRLFIWETRFKNKNMQLSSDV